jgi:hypothetical protein
MREEAKGAKSFIIIFYLAILVIVGRSGHMSLLGRLCGSLFLQLYKSSLGMIGGFFIPWGCIHCCSFFCCSLIGFPIVSQSCALGLGM